MTRVRAIVNPRSGGRRTGRRWPAIEAMLKERLGEVESVLTDAPMAATALTRQALREGVELVVAVGGDGTIDEVVNGFFDEHGRPLAPDAELGIVNAGTGGDFRRSFGIGGTWQDCVTRLAEASARPIDLGRIEFVGDDGEPAVRWFDNIASFGVSGTIVRAVDRGRWTKRLLGPLAFRWHTIVSLLSHDNPGIRIRVDDEVDEVWPVTTAAVCNGGWFGGGMWIAPPARVDDGRFELVIVHGHSALDFVRSAGRLNRGEHLGQPGIVHLSGRRIVAEPVDPDADIALDVDGESPGRLPATFEVRPAAIKIRA